MVDSVNSSSNNSILNQLRERQETIFERLASGRRINSAADGAAAQQIIDRLSSQEAGLGQALRNTFDGISLSQVADAGLGNIGSDVQRIRELTVQAGNGLLNESDRRAIQQEITALQENIQGTIETTSFAGRPLLSEDANINFQTGANAGQQVDVSIRDTNAGLQGILNIDITTDQGRADALQELDSASEFVNEFRADLGATQNRFESTARSLSTTQENVAAANSRIGDLDFAQATTEAAAIDVQNRAALSVQTQANQQQGQLLSLLG